MRKILVLLALASPLGAQTYRQPPGPSGTTPAVPVVFADTVTDFTFSPTDGGFVLQWTEVGDGTGNPADYQIVYHAQQPIPWVGTWVLASQGNCAPLVQGTGIGNSTGCMLLGLAPSTVYDLRIVSGPNGSVVVPPDDELSILTSLMPRGQVGVRYSFVLTAAGGECSYTWAMSNGDLPAGLTLNSVTGLVSGVPTAAGTTDFVVEVTSCGETASASPQMAMG